MRKAGIIGGMGPASTLDYYSGIIDGYRAAKNDGSYPSLTLESVNMAEMLAFVKLESWSPLVSMLLAAVRNLKNAGAEFYDQEVVVDKDQLVTSRTPDDLPAFNREALRLLGA